MNLEKKTVKRRRLKLFTDIIFIIAGIIGCFGSIIHLLIYSILAWMNLYRGGPFRESVLCTFISLMFLFLAIVSLIIIVAFYSDYRSIKKGKRDE